MGIERRKPDRAVRWHDLGVARQRKHARACRRLNHVGGGEGS